MKSPNRPRLGVNKSNATVIWFDPGSTTGVAVCTIRKEWLDGKAPLSYEAMKANLITVRHYQTGRHRRLWDYDANRAIQPDERDLWKEITATLDHDRSQKFNNLEPDSIKDIIFGNGLFAGGELTLSQAEEIVTTIQCQNFLNQYPDAAWGYEDFILRGMNQSRDFLAPVRLFTALTYSEITAGARGRVPFVQNASMAKSTATDERLIAAGLYRPGMPHANDAARHIATFLRRARKDEEIRKGAWPHLYDPERAHRIYEASKLDYGFSLAGK